MNSVETGYSATGCRYMKKWFTCASLYYYKTFFYKINSDAYGQFELSS